MPEFTTHLSDLAFPEGPQPFGEASIVFTDLRDQVVRVFDTLTGGVEALATFGGAPNGLRLGPDGDYFVANNGGLWPTETRDVGFSDPQLPGTIQRLTVAGEVSHSVHGPETDGPMRPNDLVFASDGRVVFTDPRNWEVLPDVSRYERGRLYAGAPESEPTLLCEVDDFPNGLGFHPDGSLLVGLTERHALVKYDWHDGIVELDEPVQFCDTGVDAPDGLIIVDDLVVVAGSTGDGISIFDLDGHLVDRWTTGPGSDPTNLCVAYGRLWVTLGYGGALVSCEWPTT